VAFPWFRPYSVRSIIEDRAAAHSNPGVAVAMVNYRSNLLSATLALQSVDLISPTEGWSRSWSTVPSPNPTKSPLVSNVVDRRTFGTSLATGSAAFGVFIGSHPSQAFDGSGASASSGFNPATKAERVKGWKQRVIADVKDFNRLGNALRNGQAGDTSKEWINFFIKFQRREPDEVGRTYGALVDLRGLPTKKKYEYEGGDGLLLATSFTKSGKPPENTPAVKAWNKLFKLFDNIEAAGKSGNAPLALAEWEKTKPLLEEYLSCVELPTSLSDSAYN